MSNPGDFVGGLILIGAGLLIPVPGVSGFLISFGIGLSLGALKGPPRESVERRIEGVKFNSRSTQAPIPVVYGVMRVGLNVNDIRIIDSTDPDTPNANPSAIFTGADNNDVLVKTGAFCLGSEDGSGIQAVNNIRVYDDGFNVVANPGAFSLAPSNAGVVPKYSAVLKYTLEEGNDAQTPTTSLQDQLGWTTDMKGQGIAYGAFYFRYDEQAWDSGVPQITADITGNRVYDPRTSTWIDFATSGASADNSALVVLDYLTSKRYGGNVPYAARDGGSLDFIDEQSFIDAANYCDDLVSIPGATTEKRFRTNAVVSGSRVVGANLAELLATCRGELIWQGGTYRLVIRQVTTAETFELTEDNIVGEIAWTRKGTSIPNLIEATFPDDSGGTVDSFANSVVWPLIGDTTLLDEDNGVENRVEVALPFTKSYYQALRTIMVSLREGRNDVHATLEAHQSAYVLQIGEVVKVTHEGPEWVQLEFTVRQMDLTPQGTVILSLQQYTAAAYVLDTLDAQPSVPTANLPDPLRSSNFVDFIYERPASVGAKSNGGGGFNQFWRRELSYFVGKGGLSVEIDVGSYLIIPTLDSGSVMPINVEGYRYHVDVTPDTTITDFIKIATPPAIISDFSLVDGVINLDNTNNGVAQNFTVAKRLEVNKWTFELARVGSPTGDVVAKIYEDNGSGLPGALLATSYVVDASLLRTGTNNMEIFPFATPGIVIRDGLTYHVSIEYSDGTATDYITVGVDLGGSAFEGTSKVLNGSWIENGPVDMPHIGTLIGDTTPQSFFSDDDFSSLYQVLRDEFIVRIGGAGQITIGLEVFSLGGGGNGGPFPVGGIFAARGTKGSGTTFLTKTIPEYDDIGWRSPQQVDRREEFNENFGSPGAGPNDLVMNNVANGFAVAFVPERDYDASQIGVYLKRTASPTGNVVGRIYSDTPSETGTVTTENLLGDVLIDSTALFITNNVRVGALIVNSKQVAIGRVLTVDSETQVSLTSGGLSQSKSFIFSDAYSISGVPNTTLATSDNIDSATLPTTYPTTSQKAVFPTPPSLTGFTIYWLGAEYSNGTAVNFVSVSAETGNISAELNGAWASGITNELTYRIYSDFTQVWFTHEGTPGLNLSTTYDEATAALKWDAVTTGGGAFDTAGIGLDASGSTVLVEYEEALNIISEGNDLTGITVVGGDRILLHDVSAGANRVGFIDVSQLPFVPVFPLLAPDGSAGAPSYSFASEPGLGVRRVSAGLLGITGNLQVDNAGPHAFGATPLNLISFYLAGSFTSGGGGTTTTGFRTAQFLTGAPGDTAWLAGTQLGSNIITQTAVENITTVAQLFVSAPIITDNLTGSIATAATVYIAGAPTGGLTNASLYVALGAVDFRGTLAVAGNARFDGNIDMSTVSGARVIDMRAGGNNDQHIYIGESTSFFGDLRWNAAANVFEIQGYKTDGSTPATLALDPAAGGVTIGGTLAVTGAVTFLSALTAGATTLNVNSTSLASVLFVNNEDTSANANSSRVTYQFRDTSSNLVTGAALTVTKEQVWTPTASTQDAQMSWAVTVNGALTQRMTLGSDGLLTVNEALTVGGTARAANGSVGAPTWSFTNDTDTGMYRPNTNDIALVCGAVTRLYLDGITTTTGLVSVRSSQFYVEEQTELTRSTAGAVTVDWDLGNVVPIRNDGNIDTINIDDNGMQPGGSYVMLIRLAIGGQANITFAATGTLLWARSSPPVSTNATVGDRLVVHFYHTTGDVTTGSWVNADS